MPGTRNVELENYAGLVKSWVLEKNYHQKLIRPSQFLTAFQIYPNTNRTTQFSLGIKAFLFSATVEPLQKTTTDYNTEISL